MSDNDPTTPGPAAGAHAPAPKPYQPRPPHVGWAATTVAIVLGLFYVYYLFDAIRSLVILPGQYEQLGLSRADAPWALLIIGVLVPVVVYVLAFVVGLRRNAAGKALVLLAGLGLVACLNLSIIALA